MTFTIYADGHAWSRQVDEIAIGERHARQTDRGVRLSADPLPEIQAWRTAYTKFAR